MAPGEVGRVQRAQELEGASPPAGSGGALAGVPAVGQVLDWVARYGIATVFAAVLLAFLLLSTYQQQQVLLEQHQEQLARQAELARTQAETLRQLTELARQMERLAGRLDALPAARPG